MTSLGLNESNKDEVGLSHVLQEHLLLEAMHTSPCMAVCLHLGFALAWNQVPHVQGQTRESQSVLSEGN